MDSADPYPRWIYRRRPKVENALFGFLRAYNKPVESRDAEAAIVECIHHVVVVSMLLGRAQTWHDHDRMNAGKMDALDPFDPFGVPFTEAVDDIVTREPRVVPPGTVDRMRWVSELYSREHAFAAARSATDKLTRRVQQAVAALVKGGSPIAAETDIMRIAAEEAQPWARWYAATVFRTNASTNYTRGRIAQARDPVVREVIGALEVVGVDDDRERANHEAFRGLIAAQDDPVWERATPPYGWGCRHGLIMRSIFDLRRMGLVRADGSVRRMEPPNFAMARYDDGFKPGEF